jgi:glycosyltransferase involved in cell wall biosynthesis
MTGIVQILGDGRPGGGTTAVLDLSRLLAERGEEVAILTQVDSYLIDQAAKYGVSAFGVDFSRRRRALAAARQIRRHLRRLRPVVVHAHGLRAGLPTALLPRRKAWRLVYTVHGFSFPSKLPAVRQLTLGSEAFCMARADCTVFVSDGDFSLAGRCHLLAMSRDHRIIRNAVLVEPGIAAPIKRYDIGFLGRLHPQKNPLILVDVLVAMRPLRPQLCVVGGGALEPSLRARIEAEGLGDQVTLCGELDRARGLRMISACSVLLLPSRSEGHPITLVEAMHLGLPAVASDISGSNEIIVDGETGYLVPVQDVAAYAERLTRLLADAALRRRMADNARRRLLLEEYSIGRSVAAHLAVYREDGAQLPHPHRLETAE